jgi:2-polyprenyl-6-methoxyphenol hydroxylase-like FAD-dependent oxidoreductase
MRADAERLVARNSEVVRLIEELILQPIYDLESPRMAFGRVAIVGDAAFVARPHAAAGVSRLLTMRPRWPEAIQEEENVESALRRYQAARFRRTAASSSALATWVPIYKPAYRGRAGARRPAVLTPRSLPKRRFWIFLHA